MALVLNSAALTIDSGALGAVASPVAYLSPEAFVGEVLKVVKNVEAEIEFLRALGREAIKQAMFSALRFAVLCTKHPGFREEQEWRVIASPTMYPSRFLAEEIEVVRGAPQTVLKLSLENHPAEGLVGLTVPELLDRVIIGPCEYPVVTVKAFHRLLSDAGVAKPETRVTVSGIPLRHA